jgi:hypothetical protein
MWGNNEFRNYVDEDTICGYSRLLDAGRSSLVRCPSSASDPLTLGTTEAPFLTPCRLAER